MDLRNFQTTIHGDRIHLKTLMEECATEEYCQWINDPEVTKYLKTKQTTVSDLVEYIQDTIKSADCLFFGIFWKENSKHIGNIKLELIDFKKSSARVGLMIGDKNFWGRGVATEAIKIITKYAFEILQLREVNLGVASGNQAAIKVYEKCGFKIYQIEPGAIDYCEKIYDQVLMKKTNQDVL